jgi:phage FluMu gp28-like protein
MSSSVKGKIDRAYDEMQEARERQETKNKPLITDGILEFCKNWLDFKPFSYQEKLLLDPAQFIVARWCRQSGKSSTIAAKLLHSVLSQPRWRAVILAPSLRQSRKNIAKINWFAQKIRDKGLDIFDDQPTTTKLVFRNASTIEALPNNPATIRGDTTHIIFADELNYVQKAEELYEAMVYTLNTTNGKFIGTSTPGSRDSLFYKMCTDDVKFARFSRHHVRFMEALEPNGPLKPEIVERVKVQMNEDPWRWQREMEAEFAEDEDAFFTLSLIERCVVQDIKTFDQSDLLNPSFTVKGVFYAGCDLGKKRDHSAIAVVEKTKEGQVRLVHLKRFRLETEYAQVTGYLHNLNKSLDAVHTIEIDQTGVGDAFVEETIKSGLRNAHGTVLTLPMKQQILVYMKKTMQDGRLGFSYDQDLNNEINVERYKLNKTGQTEFSHPDGTHDDRLWALALAVYASRPEIPPYHPVILLGSRKKFYLPGRRRPDWTDWVRGRVW